MTELDDYAGRHSHIVAETADRQSGFALFGGWNARHLFQRLYLDTSDRLPVRPVFHRTATADYCRGLARRYGLVVFCGNSAPPALAPELLSIPVVVDMEMATPSVFEGPGARWCGSVKNDLRRIRHKPFAYDIQHGDAWVPEFYRRMFQPTLARRHGAEGYSNGQRQMARHARTDGDELVRVLLDGKWVAGAVNRSTALGYQFGKLAWAEGDEDLLRSGAAGATYWFSLQRAAALGHARVLLGPVAPYLEDGLLLYKAKWGARLSADSRDFGEFRLLLDPSHSVCRRFLQAHTLVTRGTRRDFVVFSGGTPATVGVRPALLAGISRWYTWRNQPFPEPGVWADEVPQPLRPWLDAWPLTGTAQPD